MLSTCVVYSHCLKIKLVNIKKKKSKFKQSSSNIVTFGHLYVIVDGLLFSFANCYYLGCNWSILLFSFPFDFRLTRDLKCT